MFIIALVQSSSTVITYINIMTIITIGTHTNIYKMTKKQKKLRNNRSRHHVVKKHNMRMMNIASFPLSSLLLLLYYVGCYSFIMTRSVIVIPYTNAFSLTSTRTIRRSATLNIHTTNRYSNRHQNIYNSRIVTTSLSNSSNNNNNNNESNSNKEVQTPQQQQQQQQQTQSSQQPSLAEMEDAVEQNLESNIPLESKNYSNNNNNNSNNNNNNNKISLSQMMMMKAPTSLSSSSNTFYNQQISFEQEDEETMKRQEYINEYLKNDDEIWKRQRLEKMLGKYKDILLDDNNENNDNDNDNKNKNDNDNVVIEEKWKMIIEEERIRIENENKLKSEIAKKSGIELNVLEREIPLDTQQQQQESIFNPTNIKGKSNNLPSWFDDEEYNSQLRLNTNSGSINGESSDGNSSSISSSNSNDGNMDVEQPFIRNGKLVINEQTLSNGIRVGSAGGWSLEVFPGDFVVHRKYGIGKYEQTIVKPKTKLTKDEVKAQKSRRNDIVKDLLAKRKEKSMTAADIESIVKSFGTEEDKDPISNPMQTVLEVAYSDAVVHIPVEKAYRLSRYRAGDAVVKPRLSRVKGEAWRKAKRKVEEDTVQMAQDVLALYATRETLTRTPFDPTKESKCCCFFFVSPRIYVSTSHCSNPHFTSVISSYS